MVNYQKKKKYTKKKSKRKKHTFNAAESAKEFLSSRIESPCFAEVISPPENTKTSHFAFRGSH